MTSSAKVFENIAEVKTFKAQEGDQVRNPDLPPNGEFLLKVKLCQLTEGEDCGDCFVAEFEIVESSTPAAARGQIFKKSITHLLGEYMDLKQGQVRNFVAAVFGMDEADSSLPWVETTMYVTDKGAAVGRMVRAKTDSERKSKGKGRMYTPVHFTKA